ncbi:glycosyltransferase family 4 protein [Roseivirga sp. UBA838]|uniref:glycosyltransferase family 4 protein n=1 Tax=Roseivirga sp. UBA838 TaxID=1947393 RepID=UPI00257A568E|nr:glycosyltransferase family 4 protein [Roseivirga sp. UBA838]|tara:strand:+ start:75510 stop:76655 length:1146 start_codon:yes stop_codon:yes gene_type:complete
MKIVQVHNIYQGKTGEEAVLKEEKLVMEENGHEVVQFIKDNSDLDSFSKLERIRMLLSLNASTKIADEFGQLLDTEKPDVCHVHNTFPIITPVVYEVCRSRKIPVVQTLHNYKMICTNSLLFQKGEVCELCINRSLYHSIQYKCYRGSYLATAAQAHVIQHHRNKGTWDNLIDKYICLTEFQKQKLVSGGLPEAKAVVKPNFLTQAGTNIEHGSFFLFVGRLNDSKGLQDLLQLFKHNKTSRFILIGKAEDPAIFKEFRNVDYLGEQERDVVLEHMRKCKAVLFPSKYYEGMPMVILEAFSHQKPVVARNTGAMSSMIEHEVNGLKYDHTQDFLKAVERLDKDEDLVESFGKNALKSYFEKYSKDKGYSNLLNIYSSVLSH